MPDPTQPAAIDEFHASDHAFSHADLVGRDQPVVIRGLRGDWPVVAATRKSDTVFTTRLAGYDNDADTLPIAAQYQAIRGLSNETKTYPERTNIHRSKYLLNL